MEQEKHGDLLRFSSEPLRVVELSIKIGRPKEAPPLICPHCSAPTSYEDVEYVYNRYKPQGYVFKASVHAHVCNPCNTRYYLPEVNQAIREELSQVLKQCGLVKSERGPGNIVSAI